MIISTARHRDCKAPLAVSKERVGLNDHAVHCHRTGVMILQPLTSSKHGGQRSSVADPERRLRTFGDHGPWAGCD